MARLRPFHLAFPIKDIQSTRVFYTQLLGCTEGRSTNHWIDFDFFGNQISGHIAKNGSPLGADHVEPTSEVDGIPVPLKHFGAILEWNQFIELSKKLQASNQVSFVIPPQIRYPGKAGEQYTMFFRDPSGNALEFKAFKNEDEVFQKQE